MKTTDVTVHSVIKGEITNNAGIQPSTGRSTGKGHASSLQVTEMSTISSCFKSQQTEKIICFRDNSLPTRMIPNHSHHVIYSNYPASQKSNQLFKKYQCSQSCFLKHKVVLLECLFPEASRQNFAVLSFRLAPTACSKDIWRPQGRAATFVPHGRLRSKAIQTLRNRHQYVTDRKDCVSQNSSSSGYVCETSPELANSLGCGSHSPKQWAPEQYVSSSTAELPQIKQLTVLSVFTVLSMLTVLSMFTEVSMFTVCSLFSV